MNRKKLLKKISEGQLANIAFNDLVSLAEGFGFHLVRTNGSHHLFNHADIPQLVNLQEVQGEAKPYQIRQLLRLIEQHNLRLESEG
jgi:predicted RNA binding protein YcfA (HicA-like mRNA interferase family)